MYTYIIHVCVHTGGAALRADGLSSKYSNKPVHTHTCTHTGGAALRADGPEPERLCEALRPAASRAAAPGVGISICMYISI